VHKIEKNVVQGIVRRNREIHPGIFKLELEVGRQPSFMEYQPGQFVNVYLGEKDLLLPRPLSISMYQDGLLCLVYQVIGAGTLRLAKRGVGDGLAVSSPLGKGFVIKNNQKVWIVAGGCGIAPLPGLCRRLVDMGCEIAAYIGFRQEAFLLEEVEKFCKQVHVASQKGTMGYQGTVLDLLQDRGKQNPPNQMYACGPKEMLREISKYAVKEEVDIQVSLEERMGCGYGACLGCSVWIRDPVLVRRKVCCDGPVFDGKKVVWDDET